MDKTLRQKLKVFLVISLFQNSLKIKKNFVREILLKAKLFEGDFTKEDSYDSLKCIQNDKSQVTMD